MTASPPWARRANRTIDGQRVLITGGSSGIGLATAQQLVAAGARVVLVARGEPGLRDAAHKVGVRQPRPRMSASQTRSKARWPKP